MDDRTDLDSVSEGILANEHLSDIAKYHESNHRYMTSKDSFKRDYWMRKMIYYRDKCNGETSYNAF
jgi:hypothetical protein